MAFSIELNRCGLLFKKLCIDERASRAVPIKINNVLYVIK